MAQKYLVTGGTGFIGSALVRALVARGESVRVLDNGFRGRTRRLEGVLDKLELVEGDVRDPAVARKAVEGITHVAHLAAINGTKHFYEIPDQVLSVGVEGTLRMLDAAREEKVNSFFFASSSEVYQTPPTCPTDESVPMMIPDSFNPRYSYGGSKLIGELLTANYGRGHFRSIIFRPHNVYGPDMGHEHVIPDFIERLAPLKSGEGTQDFEIQGTGEETRAFCFIDDFIAGLLLVMDKGKDQHLYHIGTDEEISIRELAERTAKVMEVDIALKQGPLRAGGTPRRCPDIGRIRDLGYVPETSLEAGLAATIPYYLENPRKA